MKEDRIISELIRYLLYALECKYGAENEDKAWHSAYGAGMSDCACRLIAFYDQNKNLISFDHECIKAIKTGLKYESTLKSCSYRWTGGYSGGFVNCALSIQSIAIRMILEEELKNETS